jgi:hypothetical protein
MVGDSGRIVLDVMLGLLQTQSWNFMDKVLYVMRYSMEGKHFNYNAEYQFHFQTCSGGKEGEISAKKSQDFHSFNEISHCLK